MLNKVKSKLQNILNSDKSFKDIIEGSIYNITSALVGIILGFGINLIIARYYGAGILGQFSLITNIVSIIVVFTLLGTNTALLRLIPEHIIKFSYKSAYNIFTKIVIFVTILSILISSTSYLFAPQMLYFFKESITYISLLKTASIFLIFNSLFIIFLATIRSLGAIKVYAIIQIVLPISNFLLLLFLTLFFKENNIPLYSWILSYIISFCVALYFLINIFNEKIDKDKNKDKYKKIKTKSILSISFPMFLTSSIMLIISQVDILMLGVFKDEETVGIYTIVAKLSMLTNFILITINTIIAPKFSKLYFENRNKELFDILRKSTILIFLFSLPIVIFLIFLGKYLLLQFGDEFLIGYSTLFILVFGYGILLITGPIEIFLNMTGHQKELNYIYILGGLINIILNYFFIPIYGMIGAAITTLVSLSFIKFLILIYIKYRLR